ncbi:Fiber protein Fb11, partial [Quillaja saponaria]
SPMDPKFQEIENQTSGPIYFLLFQADPLASIKDAAKFQESREKSVGVIHTYRKGERMAVMEKLRMFVAQEPVVAASCLIAGVGLFLPAVVRPILDSYQSSKQVPQPALSDGLN